MKIANIAEGHTVACKQRKFSSRFATRNRRSEHGYNNIVGRAIGLPTYSVCEPLVSSYSAANVLHAVDFIA
jgi:hypothetical protein